MIHLFQSSSRNVTAGAVFRSFTEFGFPPGSGPALGSDQAGPNVALAAYQTSSNPEHFIYYALDLDVGAGQLFAGTTQSAFWSIVSPALVPWDLGADIAVNFDQTLFVVSNATPLVPGSQRGLWSKTRFQSSWSSLLEEPQTPSFQQFKSVAANTQMVFVIADQQLWGLRLSDSTWHELTSQLPVFTALIDIFATETHLYVLSDVFVYQGELFY